MKQQGDGPKIIVHLDADLKVLVPQYLENRHKDVKSILTALERADYETIRVLGHSMRGSGGGYGFDAVSRIGHCIEQSAGEKNDELIRKSADELFDFLHRVQVVYD